MSVLRFDETTADWVIFSPSRAFRPKDGHIRQPDAQASTAPCPFCPGNEAFTPPEIYSIREGGMGAPWQVRVIPNKFPALRIEEDPVRLLEGNHFGYMAGCGAHEVIIESPEHAVFLGQQNVRQIERVVQALLLRSRDLMNDRRFQSITVFKNHGVAAGTSLCHPHWQLIATPVVPRLLRQKNLVAADHFDRTGQCLYTDMVKKELELEHRIVTKNEEFVALTPYASHSAFETWILPLRRQSSFNLVTDEQIRPLAAILRLVLLKLYTALDNPAFNLTLDTAPRGDDDQEYFLWHIRILPRLSTPAGFELGSGMSINTVMPEDAARFLNDVDVTENGKASRTMTCNAGTLTP